MEEKQLRARELSRLWCALEQLTQATAGLDTAAGLLWCARDKSEREDLRKHAATAEELLSEVKRLYIEVNEILGRETRLPEPKPDHNM